MGIVRFALKFPYTFYVLAALIVFLGVSAIAVMPEDIFPEINIPVVTVIWQYTGLSTPEMEQRVTTYSQYSISTSVTGIKNMEAQTLNGISVQKIYFQPDVNLDLAISQIVVGNKFDPRADAGRHPAADRREYNASSVPVLQLSLASDRLNEQKLYDYGLYNLRQQLAPVPGVTFPDPGRRQIPADHGRYRPAQASGQGPDPGGRRERGQCPEPDLAVGPRQDRRHAIHGAHQCDAHDHRRPQQHSDQIRQRADGVPQGCRPGARRLGSAAEHRPQRTAGAPSC